MLPMELQNAKFIWLPSLVEEVNTYVMTRETVCKVAGHRYLFVVTADSDYALFVGDRLVTGRQYADYPFYKVYDRVDVTDALSDGENTLTIVGFCANEDSSTYKKSVPGIAYALWEDGCERFHTSEATKMARHPCYRSGRVDKVTGQLGFSFEYDGRAPEPAWETPVVTHAFDTLYPRPVEKLVWKPATEGRMVANGSFREGVGYRNMGERVQFASLSMRDRRYFDVPMGEGVTAASTYPYRPASSAEFSLVRADGEDGVWCVVDIGREESGMFTLDIELPAEAEVMVGWGEHLDDMRVRAEVGTRNFACHITLPAGRTRFVHPFLRMGCRYLELHIYAASTVLRQAAIIPTDYPVTDCVDFHCADTMHNRIYETCLRTLLLCMHEHYEDCPWREQALYSMGFQKPDALRILHVPGEAVCEGVSAAARTVDPGRRHAGIVRAGEGDDHDPELLRGIRGAAMGIRAVHGRRGVRSGDAAGTGAALRQICHAHGGERTFAAVPGEGILEFLRMAAGTCRFDRHGGYGHHI